MRPKQASSAQTPAAFLILSTILTPLALAAQCTPCQTYAQDLSYDSYNFDTNAASGAGPIKQIDVGAMCLTGAGLNNMIACYACDYVTDHDLQILEAWILVCNTLKVSGQAAALACWNTDKAQCVLVDGVDAPSALSLSPSATAAATAPTNTPVATAGGSNGGSNTETVVTTEADATSTTRTTRTETSDSSYLSTSSTSGATRSGSGAPATATTSSTPTAKSNSGDHVAHNVFSNARLALWLAMAGFLV